MKKYVKKYKILFCLIIMIFVIFSAGVAYSFFHSSTIALGEANIAKFIFNTNQSEELYLPLIDLNPGDELTFPFEISNSSNEQTSDVSVEYRIIIKTFHLAPLNIKLYKVNNDIRNLVLNCNETYSRNSQNEIVCNTAVFTMSYVTGTTEQYELDVTFPSEYNSEDYTNLLDYVNLEIKSWQKIE